MLNVPESIKTLYQTDGINKNFRVHFPNGENADLTNKDIVEGSVKFAESVSSKDVLKFGLSEQSKIEFECVGVQNIFGMTIECSNEIDISSLTAEEIQTIQEGEWDGTLVLSADSDIDYGYFRIPLGTFVVSSCPRSHGAMAHRRVVGYSNLFGEEYEQYRTLFDGQYPFEYVDVDLYVILFLMGLTTMEPRELTESSSSYYMTTFHNANGAEISIEVRGSYQVFARYNIGQCSMLRVDASGDTDGYERNGMAILQAINDAQLDILYDAKKKKIFATTEDALRTKMPMLFYPVALGSGVYVTESGTDIHGELDNHVRIKNGYTTIVTGYDTEAIHGVNPSISKTWTPMTNQGVWAFVPTDESYIRVTGVSLPDPSGRISYDIVDYDYHINSVEALSAPSDSITGCTFRLRSSLKANGVWYDRYNNSTVAFVGDKKYTKYFFQNAISVPELIKGFVELNAQFGRIGRQGGETKKLSKQNPINIEPSDVEDLWWDEYDVEQIGTVRYNIADTQSIVEYQIGNGGSVYDFGDNYCIKRIFASYTEDNYTDAINLINSLIDQYFVPNVTDVPFVPVDMTMRGLPYVESGDYIVYDDGIDQVGTYVLNREMDGVQTLFDDIESNGGEVMGK